MMMVPLMVLGHPQRGKKQNPAFVKLLETVTGPSGHGMATGHFGERQDNAADGTIENEPGRRGRARGDAVVRRRGLFAGEALAQSSGGGLPNLFGNMFSGQNAATPAQAQPAPAGSTAPPALDRRGRRLRPSPDDGERDPGGRRRISTIALPACGPMPHGAAFRRTSFQKFTAGLAPDLRIMDLMDSQPEFTKAIWDYLDILVNDNRMAKGREVLAKYKPQFDAVEKAYGVDRYIVASIWGIESNYSTHDGRSQRAEFHRDAGLHRPPPEILQGRVSGRAGNPASRRSAPRTVARLLGRRVRPDAVHADRVQALRRRRRRRRPPRRGRQSP